MCSYKLCSPEIRAHVDSAPIEVKFSGNMGKTICEALAANSASASIKEFSLCSVLLSIREWYLVSCNREKGSAF